MLTASQEIENGIVTFLKSQVQTRYMAESVTAAKKAVVVAIAQYQGGLTDFNRVSLVEQNLVQQQNLYAQALGSIALGLVQTFRALGGGWEIRLDPASAGLPGLPPPDPNREAEGIPAPSPLLNPPPVKGPIPPLPPPDGPLGMMRPLPAVAPRGAGGRTVKC